MKKSILAIGLSTLFATQALAQTCPQSTPTADFLRYTDGVVIHKPTGLMWQACSVGQTWEWQSGVGVCHMPTDLGDTRVTFEDALAYMEFDGDITQTVPTVQDLLDSGEFSDQATAQAALDTFIDNILQTTGQVVTAGETYTIKSNPVNTIAGGYNDWRIPNAREMLSLFETCATPSSYGNSYVNSEVFPNQFVDASSYQHNINRINPDPSAAVILRNYVIYGDDANNSNFGLYNNDTTKNFFFNTFLTSTLGGGWTSTSDQQIHVAHFHPIHFEGGLYDGVNPANSIFRPGQRLGTTSLFDYNYGVGSSGLLITSGGNPMRLFENACDTSFYSISECHRIGGGNGEAVNLGFRLRPVRKAQSADYNRSGLIQ